MRAKIRLLPRGRKAHDVIPPYYRFVTSHDNHSMYAEPSHKDAIVDDDVDMSGDDA